jgi:hypothetical protein
MKMTKGFLGLAVVGLMATSALAARNTSATGTETLREPNTANEFGLGLIVGEPTGPTGKLWLSHESAVDFGLAFSFNNYTLIYSDYLYHFPGAFGNGSAFAARLVPYVGIGGELAFAGNRDNGDDRPYFGRGRDTFGLGVRVPLGMEWFAPRPRLGVFAEIVPGISLIPNTSSFVDAGLGARFYF